MGGGGSLNYLIIVGGSSKSYHTVFVTKEHYLQAKILRRPEASSCISFVDSRGCICAQSKAREKSSVALQFLLRANTESGLQNIAL